MSNQKTSYPLIPMGEIADEARKIAVAWCDNWHPIGSVNLEAKHKLASDIMNYARNQHPTPESVAVAFGEWNTNMNDAPRDGSKILMWHQIWGCPVAVQWEPDEDDRDGLPWLTCTRDNSWPVEAFSAWMPLPNPPTHLSIKP